MEAQQKNITFPFFFKDVDKKVNLVWVFDFFVDASCPRKLWDCALHWNGFYCQERVLVEKKGAPIQSAPTEATRFVKNIKINELAEETATSEKTDKNT